MYEQLWYTKTDYDLFGAHDELIVKIAKAGNFHETDEHSIRGLEKQLGDGNNDIEYMAIDAVQQEQQRQYECGINNPDIIASIYRLTSMSSKHEARIRGIQDALQVSQSPMLGISIDGEHYCDERQNRRRKPRSRSMIHSTAEVDHSSSHRSSRHSYHSHPFTKSDRKPRSSSLLEAVIDTEKINKSPKKREPISTHRRKPRSASWLGSMTTGSYANEAVPETRISPRKNLSKISSTRTLMKNDDYLSSNFAFGKDAVTEECITRRRNRDKISSKNPSKGESKKAGITRTRPRSPRKRRSSIEHNMKINIVQ